MNRRQQAILRRYTDWMAQDMMTNPDAGIGHAKSSFYGSSHYVVDGETFWMQTTGKGIELLRVLGQPPVEVLPWSAIKRHAETISADLQARLLANRRASTENQINYPRFVAEGEAVGCGRAAKGAPLTRAQALYAEQYEAWVASGVMERWQDERAAIDAERSRLLDEALPLACDDAEPTDLLELLAAGGAA